MPIVYQYGFEKASLVSCLCTWWLKALSSIYESLSQHLFVFRVLEIDIRITSGASWRERFSWLVERYRFYRFVYIAGFAFHLSCRLQFAVVRPLQVLVVSTFPCVMTIQLSLQILRYFLALLANFSTL